MNIPKHVGIIMDGNGRWATKRGLSRTEGHLAGAKNFRKLSEYIFKKDIKYLTVYAFSTENFNRDSKEVNYLMDLFVKFFLKEFKFVKKEGIRVVFSGRKDPLPDSVIKMMEQLTNETKNNTNATLNICLNYGGQYEILDMTKKLIEQGMKSEDLTLEVIAKNLYQDLPPLDLVIRTSGELRISNFMLYQSAYAEYCFPEVLFPDFNEEEFNKTLEEFNKRNRRFGGDKYENKSN